MAYYDYTPSPITIVYQLRKEGKLDDAYGLALKLYSKYPSSDDVKKAYAWAMIDMCKRELTAGNLIPAQPWVSQLSALKFDYQDSYVDTILKQIRSLKVKCDPCSAQIQHASEMSRNGQNDEAYELYHELASAGNLMTYNHEGYGWVIYRYLRDNVDNFNSVQVRTLLRDYIRLRNERPSNLHSQILNFALNYSRKDPEFKFMKFLELWGVDNLRDEDYKDSDGNDGKKIPSLMSRIAREIVRYPKDTVGEFIRLIQLRKEEFIEMLRERCFWDLYKSVNEQRLHDAWSQFASYLESYAEYGKSVFHSRILSLAERTMKDDDQWRFYDFFRLWNPDNLRLEDWQEERGENGETYKPLAMKAIKKAYDALDSMHISSATLLDWLIKVYDVASLKFPDDDWTIRSKALLCLRAGNRGETQKIYKELSLKMGDKYYIWHEFSECVDVPQVKIGMLCKAVLIEKNEDFIGKIRLDLAEQLIKIGKVSAAALEIKLHKDHYAAKGWAVKPRVDNLLYACGTVSDYPDNNDELYSEYSKYAEEFAYSDIPYTDMVLVDEWKSPEGKIYQKYVDKDNNELVVNKRKHPLLKKARSGQVLSFKLYHTNKTIPLLVKDSDASDWSVLPIMYGYVNHVNEEKKVYHIYAQNSVLIYEQYDHQKFSKGDYVSFRVYKNIINGTEKLRVYVIRKALPGEAIKHFRSAVAVVDGINEEKQLFHFVLGPQKLSGVIRYNQTDLRPSEGDCLRIYYYVREKKEVRNPGEDKRVIEVLRVETTTETNISAIREYTGILQVKYHGGYEPYPYFDDEEEYTPDFAFVGDYYIHRNILEKYGITRNCEVKGKAVYDGKGKWKTISLEVLS